MTEHIRTTNNQPAGPDRTRGGDRPELAKIDTMVIDYLEHSHQLYELWAPQERTLLCVSDTTTARAMLDLLPNLRVIIIQGHSRSDVSDMLTQGPHSTYGFLRDAVEAGFRGRFLVISTMFNDMMRERFPMAAPWRVQLAEKADYFRRPQDFLTDDQYQPFPARDELWAEWELHYDRQYGLSTQYVEDALSWLERLDEAITEGDVSEVAGLVERMVMPVPAGDASDDRWCDCPRSDTRSLSWWHAVYHRLVNRVAWETVTAVPGLGACLRARYRADLAAASRLWPSWSAVLETYQRRMPQMQDFLRPEGPSAQWFTTVGDFSEVTASTWMSWGQLWQTLILCHQDEAPHYELVRGWLAEWEETIRTDDIGRILNHFVQIPEPLQGCSCDTSDRAQAWELWFHQHHSRINQVNWEVIAAFPGLMPRLRAALEADLSGPDQFFGDSSEPFGEVVEKSFGRRLLTFLQDTGPGPEWV